jgi:hypothetical protein
MADECDACSEVRMKGWAADWRTLVALWGIPGAAMIAAVFMDPMVRAVIWAVMLVWMGGACLANARRCNRTHCRLTGPFFVVMAALVVGYAAGMLPLGAHGWGIIGGVTIAGFAALWWGSERSWGVFWH